MPDNVKMTILSWTSVDFLAQTDAGTGMYIRLIYLAGAEFYIVGKVELLPTPLGSGNHSP